MQLIEVAFKGNRKEFFHWPHDEPPPLNAAVIVDADRGEDLGVVRATGELAQQRFAGVAHGEKAGPVTKNARRLATAEERERARELRSVADEDARRRGMERVRAHGLLMKLSDAEWQWDRRKLTFYFTAEKRVDFRALVRDLAAAFRTRIELRQIGVRDEARRLDGVGRCGRQYCSAAWLPELRPVNLGVAKDQHLSLNPLQISGACGRLMCCLRYEHEFYVQSRKRFPKEGKVLVTARGEEKVLANDIFGDRVTLRNVEGDVRVVALADLKREMAERGAEAREEAPGGAEAAEGAARARRALPVRDEARMRPPRPPRPRPETRPERTTLAAEPAPLEAEGAHAAVIPLDTPTAAAADEQRQRAERGELPADDDITPTGEDRRRRRRGRRGGRRGRGGNRDTDTNAGSASGPADQGD